MAGEWVIGGQMGLACIVTDVKSMRPSVRPRLRGILAFSELRTFTSMSLLHFTRWSSLSSIATAIFRGLLWTKRRETWNCPWLQKQRKLLAVWETRLVLDSDEVICCLRPFFVVPWVRPPYIRDRSSVNDCSCIFCMMTDSDELCCSNTFCIKLQCMNNILWHSLCGNG